MAVGCCSNEQNLVCLYFHDVVVTSLTCRVSGAFPSYRSVCPDFGPMISLDDAGPHGVLLSSGSGPVARGVASTPLIVIVDDVIPGTSVGAIDASPPIVIDDDDAPGMSRRVWILRGFVFGGALA